MPTYNRSNTIERAVSSIKKQTYSDWELIVVDDASEDNTESIIEKISSQYDRIQYIKNGKNSGPAYSRNVGIKYSQGEYIAFLDSDDEWYDYHLEECINLLKNTNYKICSALWIEENKNLCIDISKSEWFDHSAKQMSKDLNFDLSDKVWLFVY